MWLNLQALRLQPRILPPLPAEQDVFLKGVLREGVLSEPMTDQAEAA